MSDTQRRGITRRNLLKTGALAGTAAAAGGFVGAGSASAGVPRKPSGGLALVNGKIHTMDARNRVVSRVIMRDGRFVAVGNDVSAEGGSDTTVINLNGRTAVPGLIDSHTHIVLVGNRPGWHTPLEDVFTLDGVVERYQARSKEVPPGEFITTIGPVSAMQFPDQRLPNLTELDAVDRPVYIQAAQGGTQTNSLGKAWFRARGVTVNDDGSFPGVSIFSSPALQLLRENFLTAESRERTSLGALDYYAGLGLTTHLDQGAFQSDTPSGGIANENNFTMYDPFLALHAEGRMPTRLRINFLYMDPDPNSEPLSERLRNAFRVFGDDVLRTGGIGEFFAPDPTDPVTSGTDNNVRWLTAGRKVAQAGWRGENHSLTTTDFKAEIDGFALINQDFPITDLRWVVAHVPFITEDYVHKLKALGGGLKVGWGPLRTGTNVGPPYRTIIDSGIHVGYHADGGDITVINPWLNFYTMTTGRNLRGDLINQGQTISRQEALFLATAANKWFIGEDDLGSIEVGNHADLAVLNDDYFRVPDEQLKGLRSVLTVVGGQVVHDTVS